MDNSRLIAIACGLIVMLVIIMACRSCMGKPDTSGLKKPQKSEPVLTGVAVETGAPVTEPPQLDIFGRPVTAVATETPPEFSAETTTETVETDIFGNIVTSAADETDVPSTEETDVPDTMETAETGAFPDTTTEAVPEIPTEVPTLSPFEQYEQDLNDPDSIGGFNHGRYDDEGNPVPTIPNDFTIVIN